jgi:soluble epoxide hydrolase / lipid-phosphate phosphatase
MAKITEHDVSYADGAKTISYLAAGPSSGPLIVFLHGWPAIGLTWKQQLQALALLGFRAVAPDIPVWGKSTHRRVATDYTQEALVEGMLALLSANGGSAAVWVAHDWGAVVASSLAAQHPEVIRHSCSSVSHIDRLSWAWTTWSRSSTATFTPRTSTRSGSRTT